MILNQSMSGVFGVLFTFTGELPIFLREYKSGLYGVFPYYLARTGSELPYQLLFPFVFVTIAYWMIGLRDEGGSYISFTLAILLTANSAMSLGYLLGSAAPTIGVALALGAPILLPFMVRRQRDTSTHTLFLLVDCSFQAILLHISHLAFICLCVCVCVYIYICVYTALWWPTDQRQFHPRLFLLAELPVFLQVRL